MGFFKHRQAKTMIYSNQSWMGKAIQILLKVNKKNLFLIRFHCSEMP